MAQPIRFKAVVEEAEQHNSDVVSYRLRSEKRLPRFQPGQFIHLTLDDYDPASFWPESRAFSVANAVGDRRTIDLTISRQGEYTGRIIDRLEPGSSVWAKGPYGNFIVGEGHGYSRAILIAGGTGVTPFAAFMDSALFAGGLPISEAILHYGARQAELLIYRDLADRCSTEVEGFCVQYYAEEAASSTSARVRPGLLDIEKIAEEAGDLSDTAFYLSGPKAMVERFQAYLLEDVGVASERVLIDAWE